MPVALGGPWVPLAAVPCHCVPCFIVPSVALLAPQPPPAPWKQCRAILRNLGGGWFVGEGGGARARGRGRGRFWGVFVGGFPPTHTPPHTPTPPTLTPARALPRPPCRAHLNQCPLSPSRVCALKGKQGAGGPPPAFSCRSPSHPLLPPFLFPPRLMRCHMGVRD